MTIDRLCQQNANFLSALKIAHLLIVQRLGDVETIEQDRGIAFGGISIFFGDNALEFPQAHAVFIGNFRLGKDTVALFNRLPKSSIAHDHRIDYSIGVEGKLILTQDSQLARADNITFLRLKFSSEDFHERGFAGAVWAG